MCTGTGHRTSRLPPSVSGTNKLAEAVVRPGRQVWVGGGDPTWKWDQKHKTGLATGPSGCHDAGYAFKRTLPGLWKEELRNHFESFGRLS